MQEPPPKFKERDSPAYLTMLPVLLEVSNSENLPTLHMVFLLRLLLERLEPVLPLVFLSQKRLQRFQRFGGEPVDPPNKVRLVSSPVAYTVGGE